MKDICPMCKRPVAHCEPFHVLDVFDRRRIYHDNCYAELSRRLGKLFALLTGPQEDFDKLLSEEADTDEV